MSVELNEKERHIQIFWYWRDTLESPPPSQWKGFDGTISVIVRQLHLSKGSRATVEKVLKMTWLMHTKDKVYDDRSARVDKPSNHARVIKPGSLEEQVVVDCYEDGFSLTRRGKSIVSGKHFIRKAPDQLGSRLFALPSDDSTQW